MGKFSTKGVVAQVHNLNPNVFSNLFLINFPRGDFVNVLLQLIVVVLVAVGRYCVSVVPKCRPYRQGLPTATIPIDLHFRAHSCELKAECIL